MGPCEMPLIEFIVAEQDYEEDGDDGEEEEEDYYGGEGDLADVAMEEGCTAACQDILGRSYAWLLYTILRFQYCIDDIDVQC